MSNPQFARSKSKFGKWLDVRGIYPSEFAERFHMDMNELTELVYEDSPELSAEIRTKLRDAIREIDPTMNTYDFWTSHVQAQTSRAIPPQI